MQAHCVRYTFTPTATVETELSVLDCGFEYADSGELRGRASRSVRTDDERILWLFEYEEDAILFACKIGGIIRGPVNVPHWQRQASRSAR